MVEDYEKWCPFKLTLKGWSDLVNESKRCDRDRCLLYVQSSSRGVKKCGFLVMLDVQKKGAKSG